jgi:RNA polymerase sigma-70 factor (ECF subfamily)
VSDDHDGTVTAIAAGDMLALERLYRELGPAVYALAVSIVRDRTRAEDVVHDAFLRVWRGAALYRPGTSGRAWTLGIARNVALDALRRETRRAAASAAAVTSSDEPASGRDWVDALLTLDATDREIVVLHELAGITHAEIAALLEMPAGTVRWRARRALGQLAPLLTEDMR